MPKLSPLALAKNDILSIFSKSSEKIYSRADLASVLFQNRRSWHLADHTTSRDFISFLTKHGNLRAHKFRSETYGQEIIRYSWGEASLLELAISIKPRAYLCHATALVLHGLAKLSPKTIYLNVEQSAKPPIAGSLTQEGINRAFSGKQRQSNLIYNCNGASIIMIAGKNTDRLGVEQMAGPTSESLQVTNLERTLIDIVVRPAYGGGTSQVRKAYRAAKDRMSIDRLLAILKKLDYVYPYHQSIGFLMHKTGYPEKSCAKLRALGLNHDFYLSHGLHHPEYSNDWRLFYPKDFK
jgi:predicted transcriptional regulator of viral defense system